MRPMPELEVTSVRTSELVPYAGNAKLHPHDQIDQIAQSIQSFGNNDPIAVWHNGKGEMEIVEGHGRLLALHKLGIEEAQVIFLDHLSDAQRRAYTHIHNQLAMNTGFDTEILKDELAKIDAYDMDVYGFSLGVEISSDEWTSEQQDEVEHDFEEPDEEDVFHCLFVYHTDEEARRLMSILGVDELESTYEMEDIA